MAGVAHSTACPSSPLGTEVGHSFIGLPGFSATHASTSAVAAAIARALRTTSGAAETRSFSRKSGAERVRLSAVLALSAACCSAVDPGGWVGGGWIGEWM